MVRRFGALLLLAAPAIAQSPVWGQCGGIGWSGSTSCVSGSTCIKVNDYYYQCQPGGPTTVTTTSVPTPTVTPTTTITNSPTPTSTPTDPGVCPALPGVVTVSNTRLPDPFTFVSGSKVTSKANWSCRQKEISALFQNMELGTVPPKPSTVTASLSGTTLSITASEAGKSITFTVSISFPSSGSAPYPAIIAYGALSIPRPAQAAVITFNNDDMAAQTNTGSRGQGRFYTLYGNSHSASAMAAWAWGVSRIIDGVELAASDRIDPKRIAVTGCSRNGKGAYIAGAFEPRVALTIVQESGSGGAACWRLSDYQKSQGQNVQTATQIITENVWFSKAFEQYVNQVSRLPFDHHLLAGLVAPRGLYIIENTSQEWLGNLSAFECQKIGRKIYEALGVATNMGVSQVGNHNHCAFPSSQQTELDGFVQKFLLNNSGANTNVVRTDGSYGSFQEANWVDWQTPTLS